MRRIINGFYLEESSTRDIVEINPEEWKYFSEELEFAMRRYMTMKNGNFDNCKDSLMAMIEKVESGEIVSPAILQAMQGIDKNQFEEQLSSPEFIESMRNMYQAKEQALSDILARSVSSVTLKLNSDQWGVYNISSDVYGLFITCLQEQHVMHNAFLDNYNNKAIDFCTMINNAIFNGTDFWKLHPALKDITDKNDYELEKHEVATRTIPKIDNWLRALNQPYDGASYDLPDPELN